ncbi:hypothetical protein WICPIJ_002973 [Wickerhamomyces pijperi]|uniref:Mso1 N-terminal domain-containing protein n=1 Tax=Wickerhamomyces pijperi TaxID=599730 RepID=A0A9P8QAT9_WICPI|nr:hypothetical protein WICPIJ_002973 [Wickerhamomyces pijperi]
MSTSNLWSRVKSSTTKIHDKVSFHREEDGHTPETTVLHKAFVKYYDEHNLAYPDWLGQPVKGQDKDQSSMKNDRQFQQQTQQQLDPFQRTTERLGRLNFRDKSNGGRSNDTNSAPIGNEPRTRTAMNANSTFRDLYNSNSGGAGNDDQGLGRVASGSDRMKERLRRNNYRHNFTG